MRDFAKLFQAEGIGQILAVVTTNDDDDPCVTFRIPSRDGLTPTLSAIFPEDDYEDAEEEAYRYLEGLTEEMALKAARPMIDLLDRIKDPS